MSDVQLLRIYPSDPSSPIYQHYYNKNTKQTLEFVLQQNFFHQSRSKINMTMNEALNNMNGYNDPSDPDADDNLIHAYQTAQRIRELYPDDFNLQVTGLIHDVGKILYQWNEPDWAVVGDTFPVGCAFSDKCVYSEFFAENPDKYDLYGIYHENIGLDDKRESPTPVGLDDKRESPTPVGLDDKRESPTPVGLDDKRESPTPVGLDDKRESPTPVGLDDKRESPTPVGLDDLTMTYGHDEYLYQVLQNNEHLLPLHYQRLIRFHSFYPLHREGAYTHLLNSEDWLFLPKLKEFSSFDLYSKQDQEEITEEVKLYYDKLLNKIFPKSMLW
jgi:hypothetical protein